MSPTNYTIDDAQWATPALALTPGWNMLRTGGADEYIDPEEVSDMMPILDRFWNKSISWTTQENASTTLSFIGTHIWVYGIGGPSQGSYSAILDNKTIGSYTAQQPTTDYSHLLFTGGPLEDGQIHHLTLLNTHDGESLAYDYAIVQATTTDHGFAATSTSTASKASSSSKATASSALVDGLSGVSNATSHATVTAASAKLGNTTTGSTPETAEAAMPYSAEQLAQLQKIYHFNWNVAAYFVVIFSSLVFVIFAVVAGHYAYRNKREMRRRQMRQVSDGDSYLIHGTKPRPATRILTALRNGKISSPMPSEDGHSVSGTAETEGAGEAL